MERIMRNLLGRVALAAGGMAISISALTARGAVMDSYTQPLTADANTIALYHLDEGSGTTFADASSNHNNGTVDTLVWDANGKFGGGLKYASQGQSASAADSASFDSLLNAITAEAWVKVSDITIDRNKFLGIVGKGTNSATDNQNNSFWGLYLRGVDAAGGGGTSIGTDVHLYWKVGTQVLDVSYSNFPVDQWVHLAATYDAAGGIDKVYVGGTEAGSRTPNGTIKVPQNNDPFHIGTQPGPGTSSVAMIFDDVRISNVARVPSVPEPAALGAMMIGGLLMMRRR
jgi:hypothetical protein